ncbi:MAG: hypothetical protein WDM91_17410 [Rhizomicrobium sp.]
MKITEAIVLVIAPATSNLSRQLDANFSDAFDILMRLHRDWLQSKSEYVSPYYDVLRAPQIKGRSGWLVQSLYHPKEPPKPAKNSKRHKLLKQTASFAPSM